MTRPVCEGSYSMDDHDLVREWYVPHINGLPSELDPPTATVRYLAGVHCARCWWRPRIDAGDRTAFDGILAASRES